MTSSSSAFSRRHCAVAGALLSAALVLPPATAASATAPEASPAQAIPAAETPGGAAAEAADTAPASGSTIALSSGSAITGSTLTVAYETDQPDSQNWIGIYRESVTPGDAPSVIWQYTPETSGDAVFTLDLAPGSYHVWFLAQGGYTPLADMHPLTVTADPAAPAPLEPGNPDAPVEIDPVRTDVSTDGVLLRAGFPDGALPEGWEMTVETSGAGDDRYAGWKPTTRADWSASVDQMRDRFGRTDRGFLVADAAQFGAGPIRTTLTSAPIDVAALDSVRLTFDSHYRGAAGQSGVVRASFDGAAPVEVLRLDSTTVTDGYDGMQMNAAQDLTVDTPARAQSVVFSWEFTGDDTAHYWGIDSVTVHQAQAATAAEPTQAWVVSDIQGHPADLAHGIEDFAKLAPKADGLLMVGDIVASGTVGEWREVTDVMDASADVRPPKTVAGMGNHERYANGGFDANFQRFLTFAERDQAWGEYVLEGPAGDLPVIVLGQEMAGPSDVPMTDAQVEFLEERLAHWTAQDRQVVVMSHFPLGNTVSASWLPWYSGHHQHNQRLTSILGNYPNAVVLSGHTHYPAELGDWAMQRRTADGHADGFWAVNTLAMHIEWDARGENTRGATEVTTRDVNRGLTLDSYGDRIVITAHDFAADTQLRQVTIPNPLVPFAAELAPEAERDADYAAVDAALATVPASLTAYTPESAAAVTTAVDAVVRDLTADRQAEVTAMADAIVAAVAGLVPLTTEPGTEPGTTEPGTDPGTTEPGTDGPGTTEPGTGTAKPAPGAVTPAGTSSGAGAAALAATGSAGAAGLWAGALALLSAGAALVLTRRGRGARRHTTD
ncbi:DUF4073 domain-containing protein [Leucobacter chromiireducens]|uniref:DUF4073 domain-containing protein n=1 Tax=Leucobacter chromiireducens subsp. solipictus TaxID=398235 RepID=A0ABS1SJW5_9MICO|nr:DUF4073 domain-containing protein [Leucobacter chromiireducens]MBL3680146.1 DUF4073 domain-containing protein [Leucobacter chromiireducens subsp. solipictus]